MINEINIEKIISIAIEAGKEIMQVYNKDFEIEYKDDKSPLTEADKKADEIIKKELSKISNFPILSEEGKDISYEERKNWEYFWMVDPLDGTKEFVKRNGEFTVNIALIHKNEPILGVVYAPAIGEIYYAQKGKGAFWGKVDNEQLKVFSKKRLPFVKKKDDALTIVASKSHLSSETKDYIDNLAHHTENITLISKGSSLKLCMIATGEADVYPRLAPTMEWDTAAADAIVRESGKMTYQYGDSFQITINSGQLAAKGTALAYNKERLLNPYFVVV